MDYIINDLCPYMKEKGSLLLQSHTYTMLVGVTLGTPESTHPFKRTYYSIKIKI
jgi:hypothetical protein